jgi:hypothetical protein
MQLDIEYARNQSVWLDLKIIFKTIPVLLSQMWNLRRTTKKTPFEAVTAKLVIPERALIRPLVHDNKLVETLNTKSFNNL